MAMMQRFFDQLIQFVQQGIAYIFRVVQFIWIWSVGQITTLLQAPWQDWSPPKQGLLFLVLALVAYFFYYAAKDLWAAGQIVVGAFGTLINALVRTLPRVVLAGLIALGGVWVLNNIPDRLPQLRFDNSNGR
jgi:hypothetical protein